MKYVVTLQYGDREYEADRMRIVEGALIFSKYRGDTPVTHSLHDVIWIAAGKWGKCMCEEGQEFEEVGENQNAE